MQVNLTNCKLKNIDKKTEKMPTTLKSWHFCVINILFFLTAVFFRFSKIFNTDTHFLRCSVTKKKAELDFHNVIRCAGCAERLILGEIVSFINN